LFFAPPNPFKQPPRQYTYGKDVERLSMRQSPRRNRSFRVVVNSHHPLQAKQYRAIADQHTGTGATNFPVYQFFVEGLTQEQCSARAQAIAADIARREVVLTFTVPGDGGIDTWEGGVQVSNAHPMLEGQTFSIASVTHNYEVPQEGSESSIFTTKFT